MPADYITENADVSFLVKVLIFLTIQVVPLKNLFMTLPTFERPDLAPKCMLKLSEDDNNRQKVKL